MAESASGSPERYRPTGYQTANLIDILDRVLDKGLVVAGDISVSLANVELLTIRIRLLVCSIDKAEQIGLNWWRYDHNLVQSAEPPEAAATIARLEGRIAELERRLAGAGDAEAARSAAQADAP
jgi:hypothetical protein